MPAWVDIVVKLTPAFVALVVGLFASYVAWLQYKTNRDRLRLDLFSRRLEAFQKLEEFLTSVLREGCVRDEALAILSEARYKSRFLFGTEIEAYLDELWRNAIDARTLHSRLYGPNALPVGTERTAVCEQESTLSKWFLDQMRIAHERYATYMRFKK